MKTDTIVLPDPYHAGEQALQRRVGWRERLAEVGPHLMRDHMPDPHRELFGRLPFVLLGGMDAAGQPHASMVMGPQGFVHTPDARTLVIGALPEAQDPLLGLLHVGASIGVLGIEPHTRRRNRMNGVVRALHANGFELRVRQSFGNCPKYIQARHARWVDGAGAPAAAQRMAQLDLAAASLIRSADTFFIASAVPPAQVDSTAAHGIDVSHRGGRPGFVRLQRGTDGADVLTVPDFAGNNMFNTLGNLELHPRAGLLFIDFVQGDRLHVAVEARVLWQGDELAAFAGAQRLVQFHVREALRLSGGSRLAWSDPVPSPFLRATGSWAGTR
ncbi:MAG: pyridoxamine 5'-phosphate oxidase family protein [Burkholderiaceae bacterium]|nr:pyridoxamine 5'-phosphate oxidase family protein [Burkholderiaceae bacterium]